MSDQLGHSLRQELAQEMTLGRALDRLSIDDVGVIFHNLHDLVGIHSAVVDSSGRIVDAQLLWWNRAYEIERLNAVEVGQSMVDTYLNPDQALEHVQRAWFAGKSHQIFERPMVTSVYREAKPGNKLSVIWERVGSYIIEVATDISNAKELAAELVEQGRALDAAVASRAKVMERERIARDLHDSVIQNIFAASLRLNFYADTLPGDVSEIRAVAQSLSDVIAEIRTEIFNFADTAPEDLLPVLQRELMPIVGLGWMKISFRVGLRRITNHRLDRNVRLVIRETVTNALRHGRAENVTVRVGEVGGDVVVEVVDDGIGISPDVTRVNGLANLKSRAEELGGHMTVHSEKGRGTTIVWQAPYRKDES